MAAITRDELLARSFTVTQCETTTAAFDTDPAGIDKDGREMVCFRSWWAGHAKLADASGIVLTFSWLALGGDRTYREAHNFVISIDMGDPGFDLVGATLMDEFGRELSLNEQEASYFAILETVPWQASVEALLPAPETVDIDFDGGNAASFHTVQRDYAPDIRFAGERIASVCSMFWKEMKPSSYDGSKDDWSMLALYKTKSGKWICEQISRAQSKGGHDRYGGMVCDNADDVFTYFGQSQLASELYAESGLAAMMTSNSMWRCPPLSK